MRYAIYSLISFTLLLGCTSKSEQDAAEGPAKLPVESYQLADFETFNETILAAVVEGESWPADPVAIARKFIGSLGARSVNILREDDPGEMADSTTVIIVEEGYRDDSLRGTWHRFRLARSEGNTWIIAEVRRAYRCWRGHHLDSYSEQLCP